VDLRARAPPAPQCASSGDREHHARARGIYTRDTRRS
jgi:hypothetical protein